jgi:cytochrome c peroxidase
MRSAFKVITAGLLAIISCALLAFRHKQVTAPEAIREKLVLQADSFLTAVNRLQAIPAASGRHGWPISDWNGQRNILIR